MSEVLKTFRASLFQKRLEIQTTTQENRKGEETTWLFTGLTKLHNACNFEDFQLKLIT